MNLKHLYLHYVNIYHSALTVYLRFFSDSLCSALPVFLDVIRGPDRLPAQNHLKEMLKGKLHILQVDSTKVNALFMELSAHVVSINSEEKVIFVRFETFQEIWKFTTYYMIGFLGQCMENLLFDPTFWLSSFEDDVSIEVSIPEETLNLTYKRILMQEGGFMVWSNFR
uniref:SH3 domain and tetratricopeptide repeats 1 n=1 Tax=Echeneis naucrates TaxID=173247 RepID=A0A665WN78_ECHNA